MLAMMNWTTCLICISLDSVPKTGLKALAQLPCGSMPGMFSAERNLNDGVTN